ncbi:MAG: hypothetical protein IIV03_06865 [Clostridia bacterium]|nr:hypothetical protein [Clostridia bacterium]MBQ5649843.1 hypothetical protein [Clostridia bacterium]MBQ5808492.1 hypothetical protein [Clostridia bacterium]MBR0327252.1 hypothetical protein [Clostridia bacterium]
MKSIVRYTLISFICIAVIFTATAVALGLYFDPSVAHIELEKDTRLAQGNFETLDIELISAEKTANTVRIFFAVHIPEGIDASEVQLKRVTPHFPFADLDGGYNYGIYETDTEENTLIYDIVINAKDFPITAHPMTLEVSDLTYVENPLETIIDFTGELRFIVK